jgi:toxin ParE1/3/4
VKPVVLGRLARRETIEAASFYEARKQGLGAEFTDRVAEALERIQIAPEGYQTIHGDVRRVNLRQFRDWSLWFRVLPDNSVVVACLNNRMNPQIVKERALGVMLIRPPKP